MRMPASIYHLPLDRLLQLASGLILVYDISFHKDFRKQLRLLTPAIREKFWQRLELWQEQPTHPLINHHTLSGKLRGLHSINITGDVRAIYEIVDGSVVIFLMIGTHSQLYG